MTKYEIKTAIEEGWLKQEFMGGMPQESDGDEYFRAYVDDFIETLRQMDYAGDITGFDEVVRDGRIVGDLDDIRLD